MKGVALILVLTGVTAALFFAFNSGVSSDVETQFQDFLANYRVGYGSTDEYSFRLSVFAANLKIIDELRITNPEATFAVNKFADKTPEEMAVRRGVRIPEHKLARDIVHTAPVAGKSVDYTNMWSAVKDQGQCGSCWAFSATAAFESRLQIATGKVTDLYAEQELVDCEPQSSGCNGGLMDFAFEYLETHGFCAEDSYKYTARDGSCAYAKNACASGPKDVSYVDVRAGDEDGLLAQLVDGPVAIAVDANAWSFYSGGVFSNCGTSLDHGVTLVASNFEEGWVRVRNSWGGSWGESGHIRLKMGSNTCGYANSASVPTF
jgi:KDEL-tailed cysteine endopeptidase